MRVEFNETTTHYPVVLSALRESAKSRSFIVFPRMMHEENAQSEVKEREIILIETKKKVKRSK